MGRAHGRRARATSSARSPSCCASRRDEASELVAAETGKPLALAQGETDAAVEMGLFVAGEGRRSYGRTTTASMPHRTVLTLRRPVGVAALLISFNTPLPNVAWKAFPSIFCGNGSVLKPSEHTPRLGVVVRPALPRGGPAGGRAQRRAGARARGGRRRSSRIPRVDLVSFTGSAATGRAIAEAARPAAREDRAWSSAARTRSSSATTPTSSAPSNGRSPPRSRTPGQRCAAASRIVVFDAVYDDVPRRVSAAAVDAYGEIGPVISEASMERILGAVATRARPTARPCSAAASASATAAGTWRRRCSRASRPDAPLSCEELFGPVAALYRVGGFDDAVALVNDSPYGLTAAIHTASVHRAMRFAEQVAAGVVVVNAGTHGSEPHMGFGGVKQSGTGWKEAGVEALDVYSETQYVNLVVDPALT